MEISSFIINQIIVGISAIVIIIAKKFINKKWDSKGKGKDDFCHFIVTWLYTNCSLEGINVKEIIHIINNAHGCKVEDLFKDSSLSNELLYYLFTHKSGLKRNEEIKVAKLINEKREEVDSLPVHKVYSPVKKYVYDSVKWFCWLYAVCFLGYLPGIFKAYCDGYSELDLFICLLLVIHFVIIFVLIYGIDVVSWRTYSSKWMRQGFVIRFLERLYEKNDKVKSFFDFHTKS